MNEKVAALITVRKYSYTVQPFLPKSRTRRVYPAGIVSALRRLAHW